MVRYKSLVPVTLVVVAPLLGCSEAVPPAAEGAWQAAINAGTHTADCNLDSVNPITMGLVDATSHERLEKDTLNNAQIFCTVKQEGSSFAMEGYAADSDSIFEFSVAAITSQATEQNPASGRVTVAGPPTAGSPLSSPAEEPCSFYFVNDGQRSQLAPGRAWFTFSCPTVADVSVNRRCALQIGYAAFQNCGQ